MKVVFFAGDPTATLTARVLPLANTLRTFGVKCSVITPIVWNNIMKGKLGRIFSVVFPHPLKNYILTIADPPNVVIISKVSSPQIYLFQILLKKKGVKVIFDLDDALFLPVGRFFGLHIRPGSFYLEKVIQKADFVTVNGHYLLGYARMWNSRVTIVHDPIDTELFRPKPRGKRDVVTIGWEGDARVHIENLAMLVRPLERLAKKYDFRFKLVSALGDPRVKQIFRNLEELVEVDYGPDCWLPLKMFAKFLLDFDIMVAPLRKSAWYEGKSALRAGIGMAMGIPVVASPVGEQKYIIKHGVNGFLAKNEEEWYTYLKMLVEDESLRKEIGRKGRETAEKELSLKVNGKKLYKIIRDVAES
ncbi:MAG: glycosyltransferase family 4 protein [Thermofilaceae archaeon]